MPYQASFKYDCELSFNYNSKSKDIMKECVKYIIIDYDYKNKIMPIIYIKASLPAEIYNAMVPLQGKAKLYFKLYRTKQNVTSAHPKAVIYDEFEYYMPDDPNSFKELDKVDSSGGIAYKDVTIGLLKSELTQQNKRTFEGIYSRTNTASLIQSATSHMKMVMQPFIHNQDLTFISVPTVGSVAQFINYINSQYSFYNGAYVYFMDFDKTYLRSNDGSYIDAKDGDYKYIAFDVRNLSQYQAQMTGIVDDWSQDAYIIYVDAVDAHIETDRGGAELNSNIMTIGSVVGNSGTVQVDTSAITSINTNMDGVTVLKNNDPNAAVVAASTMAENVGSLIITKLDMDTRIFTPNKQYLLSNYEDNPAYCGIYYMTFKKEIYLRNGTEMSNQTTIGLKKVSDFAKIQDEQITKVGMG